MSVRHDITDWFQGEDKTLYFTIYNDDMRTVRDITGMTFSWEIRTTITAGSTTLTKAGVIIDAANGVVSVTVNRSDTTGLTPQTYQHALARTDTGHWLVATYGDAPLNAAAAK